MRFMDKNGLGMLSFTEALDWIQREMNLESN